MIGQLHANRYQIMEKGPEHPIFEILIARDILKGSDVLLRVFKEPFNHEADFVQECFRQSQSFAAVAHPGLERVIGLETDPEGQAPPFLVSEKPDGTSLKERIRKLVQYSPQATIATAISICDALKALHQLGQSHGDIGTENVWVCPDGTATLMQPGLWKAYSKSSTAGIVSLPIMAPYLAPEISEGSLPSPASDVYSLGVLMYMLLTGTRPYIADTPVAVAMKHMNSPVASPRALNPSVPGYLDEVVKKCMAKDPMDRYPDAGAILSDLRTLQDSLRFGKQLNWNQPRPKPKEPEPTPKFRGASPVAAVPKVKPVTPAYQDAADDRIPAILKFLITFFAALFVFVLAWWVIFNMGKPKLIEVPNIQGMTLNEAKDLLEPSRLRIIVSQRQSSEKYGAETIMDVSPEPGGRVREGSVVSVVVSSGSQFVQVPDLRGYTVDAARSLVENLNLGLDDEVRRVRNSDQPEGTVVNQSPDAGSKVQQGTKIKVGVSGKRSSEPLEETPSNYRLRIRLAGLSTSVMLRVDITDDRGTRQVYEQIHEPDQVVTVEAQGFGDDVLFRIYYDGELVKQVKQKKPTQPDRP